MLSRRLFRILPSACLHRVALTLALIPSWGVSVELEVEGEINFVVLIPFNTKSSEAEERLGRRTEGKRMPELTLGQSNLMDSKLFSFGNQGGRRTGLRKIVRQNVGNIWISTSLPFIFD